MTIKTPRLASATLALACAVTSIGVARAADAGGDGGTDFNNAVRVGLYYVHYNASAADVSGPYTPAGINLSVKDVTTPYFAYIRRLSAHWDLELAGGVPPNTHTVGKGPATVGSVPFNGQEVATARWFSPSLLVEYKFFNEERVFRPYVGVGVNYTYFYERDSTPAGDAANGGPTRISLSHSVGPAATLGGLYKITPRVHATLSYSIARVDSNYQSDTAEVYRRTRIHFNPQAVVASVGYAF